VTIVLDNEKLEQDIPLEILHPDPIQPRLHPDADLADSIKTQGILQAITVQPLTADSIPDTICPDCDRAYVELAAEGGHLLILDGERRYRGTIAAGRKTILGKVVPPSTESERLLRQLTSNTGKPLTPVEEAFSFQRLLEAQEWSQAELARQLGRPRSVVGDRIRLVEIDQVWLDLITSGRLQVSHGPIIHQYRDVPADYQAKAAKNIVEGDSWQMRKFQDAGDVIPVADFRKAIFAAFRDYIVRLDQVRSYKGPVIEVEEEQYSFGSGPNKMKKVKYAADIKLWRPIKREAEKRKKKERQSSGHSGGSQRYESPMSKALKSLKAAGLELPARKAGTARAEPKEGETAIYDDNGWRGGIDPKTLLDKIDPASIIHVKEQYGGDELFTSDVAAVTAAKTAYRKHEADVTKKELAPLRAKLSAKTLAEHAVTGPGAAALLALISTERYGSPKVVALALGLSIEGGVGDDDDSFGDEDPVILAGGAELSDAERLLSGLAVVAALKLKVPDAWSLERKIASAVGDVAFKVDKAKIAKLPVVATSSSAPSPAKSKKQSKRDARAAGKQVGDPARSKKNVDFGEIRAAVEAGTVDGDVLEEELVGA